MMPEEVENRIAKHFFHYYLPDDVMTKIVDKLLPPCIFTQDEDLDVDELVRWAIEIIEEQLGDKELK